MIILDSIGLGGCDFLSVGPSFKGPSSLGAKMLESLAIPDFSCSGPSSLYKLADGAGTVYCEEYHCPDVGNQDVAA